MTRRIGTLAAAAVLAAVVTACQSNASGDSSGGGSGGSSSGGTSGGTVAAAPSSTSAAAGNAGDGGHVRTSDDFDGCKVWLGFNQSSSSTFLVSASKEGVAGHVQWRCAKLGVGVDRLRISTHLEHSFTLGGPYTAEPASTTSGGGTNGSGNLFPTTTYCTTDWWRVRVTIGWDETGGGPMTRPDLVSESRKVTDEDCTRS